VTEAVKILEAVIKGLELNDSLRVATNRIVCGIECDIVLLYGSQDIWSILPRSFSRPKARRESKMLASLWGRTLTSWGHSNAWGTGLCLV
jgi:tRNA(His) 5'-end guanylyltransferase